MLNGSARSSPTAAPRPIWRPVAARAAISGSVSGCMPCTSPEADSAAPQGWGPNRIASRQPCSACIVRDRNQARDGARGTVPTRQAAGWAPLPAADTNRSISWRVT